MVKCFSIRFQNVKDPYEPRTADLVVDEHEKKEFFDLVERFGLMAIYAENDVWHIQPAADTNPQDLAINVSTWDIMFHKYMALSRDFKCVSEKV